MKSWSHLLIFLLCGNVTAAENLGLYQKIAEDNETSTYELIWSTYDPVIFSEPVLPEDFVLPEPDGNGCIEGLCPAGVDSGEMDRILVIGRPHLARHRDEFWVFPSGGMRVGRDTQFAGLGSGPGGYVKLGRHVVSAQQWAELSAQIANATIAAALRDIEIFRTIGGHIINPQGSVIPWQNLRVDWNLYGAGDPTLSNMDVLNNFRRSP